MKTTRKRWLIPPLIGLLFVALTIADTFLAAIPSNPVSGFFQWPAEFIYSLHMDYKWPPYGGDAGFAWVIIAPGIGLIVWFIVGTLLGSLLLKFRKGNVQKGEVVDVNHP